MTGMGIVSGGTGDMTRDNVGIEIMPPDWSDGSGTGCIVTSCCLGCGISETVLDLEGVVVGVGGVSPARKSLPGGMQQAAGYG